MKPDWLLLRVTDHGLGHFYRYHVEGINMAFGEDKPERFYWSVCDLDDPRYAPHPSAPDVAAVLDAARSAA